MNGWLHEAHPVAGDGLDLDDVGAEVAEHHRPERPGEVLAEVDDDDALERVHRAPPPGERRDLLGACSPSSPKISSLC